MKTSNKQQLERKMDNSNKVHAKQVEKSNGRDGRRKDRMKMVKKLAGNSFNLN